MSRYSQASETSEEDDSVMPDLEPVPEKNDGSQSPRKWDVD